ncbi:MAG: N-acetylneuraminate synthase [Magnetovibrio sp.]|nr:N-acetylneuraminate synthase [Magnetovibrio sp.]
MNTFIIAEAGVNHNGDLGLALKLVDAAAKAGADAVKFQTFKTDKLAMASAGMARYQKENTGQDVAQVDMLRRLELAPEDHVELIKRCEEQGIEFLSTPFDNYSAHFLCEKLGLKTIKIPSGELTNAPFLYIIASYGVNIILSTGMADMEEIREALDVLAYGLLGRGTPENFTAVKGTSQTDEGKEVLAQKLTILHCTTEYPAPLDTINLKAMDTLADAFGVPVGLSDHSEGIAVPIAAVARGAVLVEKHMTLDRLMEGPDHKASIEPDELMSMVDGIRAVEIALGTGVKKPFSQEIENRAIVRKGLFAARDIAVGETFGADDLIARRPEHGASPMRFWDLIGTDAVRAFKQGEPIDQ